MDIYKVLQELTEWADRWEGYEHPVWTRAEWREDVRQGDTLSSYAEWVARNQVMD